MPGTILTFLDFTYLGSYIVVQAIIVSESMLVHTYLLENFAFRSRNVSIAEMLMVSPSFLGSIGVTIELFTTISIITK